jgi:hypothetical protein
MNDTAEKWEMANVAKIGKVAQEGNKYCPKGE